jgi:serine/threonine-protein kinase
VARVRKALTETYRIERVLGEGGMATVYLAEDLKHHRKVAVKVMRAELAATLGAERFLREVEISAQLTHPHILPVYDSGESDGVLYYVMPYVEGESLQERMQREGQLPVEDALQIAREVAEALAYAHERKIIHRDIKPANIMMSRGHALVADFGIARATGDGGAAITKTGLAVGTPQYMSPEQASGSPHVDLRADIFALGCVLYEMVAGEPPFTGPTPQAIVMRSMTETPRPLTTTREGLSSALDAVVSRALAKSPADRWQTAQQFADALGRAGDSLRSGERVASVAPAAGPTPAIVWGVFGFASLITLGVFYGLVRRWGLPVRVLYLAVALLAIGAVVLTVTGRVEARRRAGAATAGITRLFTWHYATMGGVLALGTWALVVTALIIQGPAGSGSGGAVRLAVLPFENRGTADDAYFADGIADEVRGKLAALSGFQVTARSSSDQYRKVTKSPQDIGRELGVDYLLTATVRWAKAADGTNRVQVLPELTDVHKGDVTWQQAFDADLTDVFRVQAEIASRVAGALGVALGSLEEQQLASRPTNNLAAYDLYLKGRAIIGVDPATLRPKAILLEQAVALDSSFAEAWGELSQALATMYHNGTPDPVVARRAEVAATRALTLDPDGTSGHRAMAQFLVSVKSDLTRAEEEISKVLRVTPNDPEVLESAARVQRNLGRWDEALAHIEQARQLDPRSVQSAVLHQNLLLWLRRYPQALGASEAALAIAPGDLSISQDKAMVYVAQGDLAGAQAVIREVSSAVPAPALVMFFANYWDMHWVLDESQQDLLLRLAPASFDNDRAAWATALMQTWWLRGDRAKARAYGDSARIANEEQLRQSPDNVQRIVLYGLQLAYLGRKAEAIAQGERAVGLLPTSRDAWDGPYMQHVLARIYLLVGEPEKAIDMLEALLRAPYFLSPGWLKVDPTWADLRGNPRFERMLKGG